MISSTIPAGYGIVKGWRLPSRTAIEEPMVVAPLRLAAE
jgi:copper/silver efflux system protein